MESSRSCVRGMARVLLLAFVFLLELCKPASCQGVTGSTLASPGGGGVTVPSGGGLNLPIPIPTSRWFYDGADLAIDSCPRDEVSVNGTCHLLLTQGPCQSSEFVLLDPATLEGYCAARLCAPDRIFVFSDQLCHDPFSNSHCQGDQELFQTAFGTPICQCPDGYLESGGGLCVPTLTPSSACPPGQVLWTNNTRVNLRCGADPCGRLNLDRPLPSPPFVPALADGTCHQLGQGLGVCPPGSFFSLNLEARRGVCSLLEDAGYFPLDAATHQLYTQLYGHFTPLNHALLVPSPLLPPPQAQGIDPRTSFGQGEVKQQGGQGLVKVPRPGSNVVMETKIGGVSVSGPRGQEGMLGDVFGGDQGLDERTKQTSPHPFPTYVPQHNSHYIRGNNLGPTRHFKFHSLSKHFLPTRHDLTRVHDNRAHNHLVRPRPLKPLRPTPPAKTEVVQARLNAQALLSRQDDDFPNLQRYLAETRDVDDENESYEFQDSGSSKADTQGKDEGAGERQRRATQSSGIVETRLVTCRPGARRHVNAKCRHTLLPFLSLSASTFEGSTGVATDALRKRRKRRRRRSVAPITPALSCPENTSISIRRECDVPSASLSFISQF